MLKKFFVRKKQRKAFQVFSSVAGIVLLEVLLAIAVFSLSLTFLIHSLAQSYRATVYSRDYSKAIYISDNYMSRIFARGSIEQDKQEEGDFPDPFEEFHYALQSAQSANESVGERLNEFLFEVSWMLGGRKRSFSMQGFVFNAT